MSFGPLHPGLFVPALGGTPLERAMRGRVGWDPLGDIEGAVSSAATGLWNLATQAATSLAQVAVAIGGAFADVASDVWKAAKGAAQFVGDLPGVNVLVQAFDEATHLLKVILDSPITAICVVVLAAVLNIVGLGGPLLAEYAAVRIAVDMLAKLEDGDTFTVMDLAQATLTAASGATGLPLNAALPAEAIIEKAAKGQTITPADIEKLTVATAVVAAGASGDSAAVMTVAGVATAANMTTSVLTAKQMRDQMPPPEQLTVQNSTKLPGPVVKHLVKKAPEKISKADLLKATQDAQSALAAASRFSTYASLDYPSSPDVKSDPMGTLLYWLQSDMDALDKGMAVGEAEKNRLYALEALNGLPAFDAPGPSAPISPTMIDVYHLAFGLVEERRFKMLAPGAPLENDIQLGLHDTTAGSGSDKYSSIWVLNYLQDRCGIPRFEPPDPRTASTVPVMATFMTSLFKNAAQARAVQIAPDLAPSAPAIPPVLGPQPRAASPLPAIGLPESPPMYHPPVLGQIVYPVRDASPVPLKAAVRGS